MGNGVEAEGAQFADADPKGNWVGELHVDDGDDPDHTYEVWADCYWPQTVVYFSYRPAPLDVTP